MERSGSDGAHNGVVFLSTPVRALEKGKSRRDTDRLRKPLPLRRRRRRRHRVLFRFTYADYYYARRGEWKQNERRREKLLRRLRAARLLSPTRNRESPASFPNRDTVRDDVSTRDYIFVPPFLLLPGRLRTLSITRCVGGPN